MGNSVKVYHSPLEICQNNPIYSQNKNFSAVLTEEGNIEIMNEKKNCKIWSSSNNKIKNSQFYLKLKNDGNLMVYNIKDTPIWCSNTWHVGEPPYTLFLQNNGKLMWQDKKGIEIWKNN